jgi:hypothetical protein
MNVSDFTTVKGAVASLRYEELKALNSFIVAQIQSRRSAITRSMKRQLFVGSTVSFEDNDGKRVQGKVLKVMRKYANVDVGPVVWRVPIVSLKKVS